MAKGNELFKFKIDEIIALKRVKTSQREISKAFGRSKIVICIYLKSSNKYGTKKMTSKPEKLPPQFKRRVVHEVKRKMKSRVDAPCSTRTIRRHLNNEKLSIKKNSF